jgi:hypothetical protein
LKVMQGSRGPALSLAQSRVVGRVAKLIKATYKTDTSEETPLFSAKPKTAKLRLVPCPPNPKSK